jgi:Transmembrane secretion effector
LSSLNVSAQVALPEWVRGRGLAMYLTVMFAALTNWAAPVTTRAVEKDRGPVPFLKAFGRYARERRRDGAYNWGLFEDPAKEGRFIETFMTDSWLEHLRQHQRVTKADRILEQEVRRFQVGSGPKTTHLIGAQTQD